MSELLGADPGAALMLSRKTSFNSQPTMRASTWMQTSCIQQDRFDGGLCTRTTKTGDAAASRQLAIKW